MGINLFLIKKLILHSFSLKKAHERSKQSNCGLCVEPPVTGKYLMALIGLHLPGDLEK